MEENTIERTMLTTPLNPPLPQGDVSGSVAFAKWIGERMNVDSWFKYDARFGTWYWHMKGHLTTEELYDVFVATDR